MKEILFCRGGEYANNEMFNLKNKFLNRDDTLRPAYELKKELEKKGVEIKTADLAENFEEAKAFVFFDMPKKPEEKDYFERAKKAGKNNLYAILYEPPATRKDNYEKGRHEGFRKIMTWNDGFVDGKKYLKGNFTIPYKEGERIKIEKREFGKRKLLCMITANKYSSHPQQLYTKRREAVKWMEREHPKDFDLYGQRWDLPVIHSNLLENIGVNNIGKLMHKLNLKMWKNLMYSSYRGGVRNKKEVMSGYKFCVCFENQQNVKGYVTEKIFDAFFAGCVPVYLGASNIEKYVPKKCFIDMRKFNGIKEMYDEISGIREGEFEKYLDEIEEYLNGKKSRQFKIDWFIENFKKMVEI
ncbi:MAG: glycosyltransferase family 10 [Candidatus Micrarchaeota archaeon]